MASNYLDELAAWVADRDAAKKGRQDKHLVAFLAAKDDIRAAIETGYSLHTIWEHLHQKNRIAYSYDTFIRHVRRHLKDARLQSKEEPPSKKAQPAAPTPPLASGQRADPKPEAKPVATGFTFNPHPRKEDLL